MNSPFGCEAINVGRAVTHHALVIGAKVENADVIPHDYEDVGFLVRCMQGCQGKQAAQ